jgi:nucleoside-diphosphate-sugar epimerase
MHSFSRALTAELEAMKPDSQWNVPKNVLVWGAYGFMGRHLVGRLLAEGAHVSILTRERSRYAPASWDSTPASDTITRFETADADPLPVFRKAVASADLIFNFAGANGAVRSNQDPVRSADENSRVQAQFLHACAQSGRCPHVVFSSSRLVYGRPRSLPVNEDHPLAPRSFYAANKLCCEDYHRAFAASGAITYTICRISNAFGPDPEYARKEHGVINVFVEKALAGQSVKLFGDGGQLRDYIYIDDLIEVLMRCGMYPEARSEIFNVGSGEGIRLREAAEEITKTTGAPPIDFQTWPDEFRNVESGDYVCEIAKLRSTLGFCPIDAFRSGLAKYVAHRRSLP